MGNSNIINNRYRLCERLGSGGFGFTFLAEDLGFPHHPKCVVKQLRPASPDPATLAVAAELFQQEAETLYRLGRHPNIPGLIAHFREQGEFFLVQEYVEGHTLDREFLGGKRYDQHETIQMLGQILEILSFVHGERVIHRDVKPANIIRRSSDASLALIDFGAVKQFNPTAVGDSLAIGSQGYMPVEQLAGNPNFSSDLFALGLVAIEGLTGLKPLDIQKDPSTFEFVWGERTALLPEMKHFVSTLVRRDSRQRFPSAREALAALNQIAARAGFFQGPRLANVAATPISSRVHPQPQAEIPPTVIVSPQQRLIRFSDASEKPMPKPLDPGNKRLARIGLGFGGLALFFVVLHFAGVGSRRGPNEPSPAATRSAEAREAVPISSPAIDVYAEAMTQAREALQKESSATTRFEWEEIANKYRRTYLLLSSVGKEHPNYQKAQESIGFYKSESERARTKALEFPQK